MATFLFLIDSSAGVEAAMNWVLEHMGDPGKHRSGEGCICSNYNMSVYLFVWQTLSLPSTQPLLVVVGPVVAEEGEESLRMP